MKHRIKAEQIVNKQIYSEVKTQNRPKTRAGFMHYNVPFFGEDENSIPLQKRKDREKGEMRILHIIKMQQQLMQELYVVRI